MTDSGDLLLLRGSIIAAGKRYTYCRFPEAKRSCSVNCATISEGIGSKDLAIQLKFREYRDRLIKTEGL